MKLKKRLFILFVPVLIFVSCGVPKNFQHQLYLQDSVTDAEKIISDSPTFILPGDRLTVNITATNKTAAEDFNMTTTGQASGSGVSTTGYLVDSSGNIQLLQLGFIHAAGLTTSQLATSLQQQLDSFLKGAIVTVNISNFKINMLGEIGHPGVLVVPDGKINIIDAIIQSGDLTLYGRRDNILIVRQVNGKREFGRVDISSNKIFLSPYYNLKQNDLVYVESDKTKFISNDAATARTFRNFSYGVTILTTLILIVSLFNKK